MPTVAELTAVYGNFLLTPHHGPGVCDVCLNLTCGFDRCYACAHTPQLLDAVAPISYSVGGEQLHHALACYKRSSGEIARRFTIELAAVLWRHLEAHEPCIARAADLRSERFELVTTVPSTDRGRDERHPLRQIVGEIVKPTRGRYARLLARTHVPVAARAFDTHKYAATQPLSGASVLLIDDTWTTGASAQCAAHALKAAGAGVVAALVIGRHVSRRYADNDRRLRCWPSTFDWRVCSCCCTQSACYRTRAPARTPGDPARAQALTDL